MHMSDRAFAVDIGVMSENMSHSLAYVPCKAALHGQVKGNGVVRRLCKI